MRRLILAAIVVLSSGTSVWAAEKEKPSVQTMQPVVVKTIPESGDTKVDPAITELQVTFSKKMADKAWSWTQISDESYPKTTGKPHYLEDGKTCVLPVKLEPGKTYVILLNPPKFTGFRDTKGRPALEYMLVFETAKK